MKVDEDISKKFDKLVGYEYDELGDKRREEKNKEEEKEAQEAPTSTSKTPRYV